MREKILTNNLTLRVTLFVVLVLFCAPAVWGQSQVAPDDLLQGAAWEFSTDGGKTFGPQPPVIQSGQSLRIIARCRFNVRNPSRLAVLELTHNLRSADKATFSINGVKVKGPLPGMIYKTIPAIDAKVLKAAANELTIELVRKNHLSSRNRTKSEKFDLKVSIEPLSPDDLRIQTGPILGTAGKDYFTVACRTNMPATVIVQRADAANVAALATSPRGLYHRFKVHDPGFSKGAKYLLVAKNDGIKTTAEFFPKSLPAKPDSKNLRFVVLGDSRTNPDSWKRVAAVTLKENPDLIVHTGDLTANGRADWLWDKDFFGPANELFRRVPFYPVIGNHEYNAAAFFEFFYTPSRNGRGRHWAQRIGDVLLVGIDGASGWTTGSREYWWLDQVLSRSKAKFAFLFSHYPAWTSGPHGKLDKADRPAQRPVRVSQEIIWPLLKKYRVTAMIAGHDHCYERSEPLGGVTHIISGGAGAPLYSKSADAQKQNPYSKIYATKLHYAVFEIRGDMCTMKVITPEGEVIDTRTWKARN